MFMLHFSHSKFQKNKVWIAVTTQLHGLPKKIRMADVTITCIFMIENNNFS